MSEWEKKSLGEVTTKIADRDHFTPTYVEYGVAMISPKDITSDEKIDFSNCKFITREAHELNCKKTDLKTGDLVLTRIGALLGKICIVESWMPEFSILHSAAMIRANKSIIESEYLMYFIKSYQFQSQIKNEIQSIGVPDLGLDKIKSFKILYPTNKNIQRKISQILSTADAVIEKTQAAIAKYKAIKQGMLHDLFTRGIDLQTGKLRPKYEDASGLYKPSSLGFIPVEWEVIMIEEFASDEKNAIVDGPFGSNLKTIHYCSFGVPVIQSGFVTSNKFIAESYVYVDREKFESEIRSKTVPGDIVMAKIGAQCGTCAILPKNHPVGILAGNCLKITVSKNNSNEFLEACLHFLYETSVINNIISTTAQPAVSMSSLKVMKIKYPQPTEQIEISKRIKTINSKVNTEQTYLHKLQQLKAGLMGDLLCGRKKVSESQMERIKG